MVRFRGKESTQCYCDNRVDGKLVFDVPGVPGASEPTVLHVVDKYVHLGCVVTTSGSLHDDGKLKERNAMSSYAPLAMNIFGSEHLGRDLKVSLAASLVESRLFFNTAVVVPSVVYIRILNRAYMRLHRRINDKVNFDGTAGSDLSVRESHRVMSVDCYLVRKRLRYLKRLITQHPPTLVGLLHSAHHGSSLPWVRLILDDLRLVRSRVLTHLPDPQSQPSPWLDAIADRSWREVVCCIFFTSSIIDPHEAANEPSVSAFVCTACPSRPTFASAQALGSHQRVKHGSRNPVRLFVQSSSCPVCKNDYADRLRCIAHLSDARRPTCRVQLMSGRFKAMSEKQAAALDFIDSQLRLTAQRCGRSHHIAVQPATRPDGRIIGRISAAG